MSAVEPLTWYADEFAGPGPVIHPETEPFWTRLVQQRTFSVARCTRCGTQRYPLAPACFACLSFEHEWVDIDPAGTVSAATRVERVTSGASWQHAVPFVCVLVDLVDLAGGLRVPGRLLCHCGAGSDPGATVRICLVPTAEGGAVHAYAHSCYGATELEGQS